MIFTKTRLLALALGLTVATPAMAARNFISGQIINRNGQPVERAIITLSPGNVKLVTDAEGRFVIDYLRDDTGKRTKLQKKREYALEVFKPGFHVVSLPFFYKSGGIAMDTLTLEEETLNVADDGQNLDPGLFGNRTNSAGATYEGQ